MGTVLFRERDLEGRRSGTTNQKLLQNLLGGNNQDSKGSNELADLCRNLLINLIAKTLLQKMFRTLSAKTGLKIRC